MNKRLDPSLKFMAKSSLIVFISLLISKAISYAYRIVVARHFGIEVYGFFSIALMISSWFVLFSVLGLDEGITRYISYYRGINNKKKIKKIFKISLKVVAVTSITTGIIMFLSSGFLAVRIFHNSGLTIFLQLFSITVPLYGLSQIFLATMRGFEKISAYSIILEVVQSVAKFLSLALLIFLGVNSNSISFSSIFGFATIFIVSYLFCKKYLFKFFMNAKKEKNEKLVKEIFKYSIPLMFSTLALFIFSGVDIFLIGYLKGVEEAGIYNAALPIAMLVGIAPQLFMIAFFPIINKEYSKKNISTIKSLSKQIGKWIFIINLPVLFAAMFFPGNLINVLFGPEYLEAKLPLIFLTLGIFIWAQTIISLNLLGMIKKSNLRLFDIILSLILSVILNLIFIPLPRVFYLDNSLGLVGASIATLLSLLFYCALLIFQTNYYLKIIPVRRKMVNVLFSAVIARGLLLIMKQFVIITFVNLMLLGTFFLLVYIFLIFTTKALDKNDLMILRALKKRIKI